jgi:hypothetical protein
MKRIFVLFFLILLTLPESIFTQIPNAGFENWTNGEPDDWMTNNSQFFTIVSQTSTAHSGSSALQGTITSFGGTPISGAIIAGSDGNGWPFTDHPGSIHGYYRFTSLGNDLFTGDALFIRNGQFIGAAYFDLEAASSYTEFSSDITWLSDDNPDTVIIAFLITNHSGIHMGSAFYLDDLFFGAATGVQPENNSLSTFKLAQNYPNPFNPSTVIRYSIPKESFVTLKIYNLLGQEVATLVSEDKPAGTYNVRFSASDVSPGKLTSGIYLYRLDAGNFVQTRKMMMVK